MLKSLLILLLSGASLGAQTQTPSSAPAAADVKPGSINCEECPYPSLPPLVAFLRDGLGGH
jgi:hypothetical protein